MESSESRGLSTKYTRAGADVTQQQEAVELNIHRGLASSKIVCLRCEMRRWRSQVRNFGLSC